MRQSGLGQLWLESGGVSLARRCSAPPLCFLSAAAECRWTAGDTEHGGWWWMVDLWPLRPERPAVPTWSPVPVQWLYYKGQRLLWSNLRKLDPKQLRPRLGAITGHPRSANLSNALGGGCFQPACPKRLMLRESGHRKKVFHCINKEMNSMTGSL